MQIETEIFRFNDVDFSGERVERGLQAPGNDGLRPC